eukprot:1160761-Pelagomonas_calceolata.AAC.4
MHRLECVSNNAREWRLHQQMAAMCAAASCAASSANCSPDLLLKCCQRVHAALRKVHTLRCQRVQAMLKGAHTTVLPLHAYHSVRGVYINCCQCVQATFSGVASQCVHVTR